MAETPDTVQNLGVKITEDRASTAAVVSSLERVEKKVTDLQKTAAADRASMAESAAANRTLATSVEGLAGSLEKKFAATDKVLSVLGKATGVIGLVTGAVSLGKAAWDFFTDAEAKAQRQTEAMNGALGGLNVKLREQWDIIKKINEARAQGAAAAGVSIAGVTTAEGQRFRGLTAEEEQLKASAAADAARGQFILDNRRQMDPADSAYQRVIDLGEKELAEIDARNAAREKRIQAIAAERKRLEDDIRTRGQPFDVFGPEQGDGGGGGGGGGPRKAPSGTVIGQRDAGVEELSRTLAPDQIETQIQAVEALGAASESSFSIMARAAAEAMAPVDAFFGGLQESASAALVDVLIFGESAEGTANALAKGFARQALAAVPLELGRYFSALGLASLGYAPAVAAAEAHLVAAGTFAAFGAGGLGIAAFTGGIRGGGGGGGGGGPAPGAGAGGLGRRLPEEGGGANITVNVDYRGASIETGDNIARNVMGFVRRGMTMLGGPGLPEDDGRNRRRPR